MKTPQVSKRIAVAGFLAVGAAAGLTATSLIGSDHVDTAEVELSPKLDMNDVYAFPGSSDDRIVLVMDVASPTNALGRNVQGLDPNALYMFKIDNNGDARADLVLQILVDEMTDGTQQVNVLGPAAPNFEDESGMRARLVSSPVSAGHPFAAPFNTPNGIQGFVGHRADPFYLDFEQFVQIIPDRRPATFLTDVAFDDKTPSAFCGDTAPFDTSCDPVNIFAGANTISIVLEMPESMLGVGSGSDAALGIWGTISR